MSALFEGTIWYIDPLLPDSTHISTIITDNGGKVAKTPSGSRLTYIVTTCLDTLPSRYYGTPVLPAFVDYCLDYHKVKPEKKHLLIKQSMRNRSNPPPQPIKRLSVPLNKLAPSTIKRQRDSLKSPGRKSGISSKSSSSSRDNTNNTILYMPTDDIFINNMGSSWSVVESQEKNLPKKQWYDFMMNYTDIGANSNKYYLIQVLYDNNTGQYGTWFRWGRVGLDGQNIWDLQPTLDDAIALADAKLFIKSGYHIDEVHSKKRAPKPKPRKYTLLSRTPHHQDKRHMKEQPDESKRQYRKRDDDDNDDNDDDDNDNGGNHKNNTKQEDSDTEDRTKNIHKKKSTTTASSSSSSSRERKQGDQQHDDTHDNISSSSSIICDTGPQCTLHPKVHDLVHMICNLDSFGQTLQDAGYDINKMPLGKLDRKMVNMGGIILDKISKELSSISSSSSRYYDDYNSNDILTELSNQFYTIIPHITPGRKPPPVINTPYLLAQKYNLIDALKQIDNAQNVFELGNSNNNNSIDNHDDDDVSNSSNKGKRSTKTKSSKKNNNMISGPQHPIDAQYKAMNVNLRHVDPESPLYHLITQYNNNTHGSTHHDKHIITDIYEVDRYGEDKRYKDTNHELASMTPVVVVDDDTIVEDTVSLIDTNTTADTTDTTDTTDTSSTTSKTRQGRRPQRQQSSPSSSSSTHQEPKADLHNKQLLWHGSQITNFASILSNGLYIAPSFAVSINRPYSMFGPGIYLANSSSKSYQYCSSNNDNEGCILLCEVALGDHEHMLQASYDLNDKLRINNVNTIRSSDGPLSPVKQHCKGRACSTWGHGRYTPHHEDASYIDYNNDGSIKAIYTHDEAYKKGMLKWYQGYHSPSNIDNNNNNNSSGNGNNGSISTQRRTRSGRVPVTTTTQPARPSRRRKKIDDDDDNNNNDDSNNNNNNNNKTPSHHFTHHIFGSWNAAPEYSYLVKVPHGILKEYEQNSIDGHDIPLLYDEFVVYKPGQVRIRYICKWKKVQE